MSVPPPPKVACQPEGACWTPIHPRKTRLTVGVVRDKLVVDWKKVDIAITSKVNPSFTTFVKGNPPGSYTVNPKVVGTTRIQSSARYASLAHELVHHLANKTANVVWVPAVFAWDDEKHYVEPGDVTSPGHRLHYGLCLMAESLTDDKGKLARTRLWGWPDRDSFLWFGMAAGNTDYLEPDP